MCIRDRFFVSAVSFGDFIFPDELRGASQVPAGNRSHVVVLCLLYTSDAADDLLCVDLGGRRLIKKKTMLTYLNRLTKEQVTNHTPTFATLTTAH